MYRLLGGAVRPQAEFGAYGYSFHLETAGISEKEVPAAMAAFAAEAVARTGADCLREAGARAFARGAVLESLERHEAALELLPRLPPGPETTRRAIDVRASLSQPLYSLGQVSRMARLLDEARDLALALGDQPRLGRVFILQGMGAVMSARYAEALAAAGQALGIARAVDHAELRVRATYLLGAIDTLVGDTATAVELLTPLVTGADAELARRIPGVFGTLQIGSCGWLALCFAMLGDFGHALEYADLGVREAEAADLPQAQAWASSFRALPLVWKGEASQALPGLERAVRLCEANGLLYWLSVTSVWLGWTLARAGRAAEGLPAVERGVTAQEQMGTKIALSLYYAMWAEALLLAGQLEAAERVADRAVELAATFGERANEAWGLAVRAEIEAAKRPPRAESASGAYARAAALAGELSHRPLLARSHLGLGRLCRSIGDSPAARDHLTTAVAMFREMHMGVWLAEAEAALTGVGGP